MSVDFKTMIRPTDTLLEIAMWREEQQMRWADYGQSIHTHLMKAEGIEKVITRMAFKPGVTTKQIAEAVRLYILTGVRQ